MQRKSIILIMLVILAVLIAVPIASNALAATPGTTSTSTTLPEVVRQTVGQYKDVKLAEKAGYGLFHGCVSGPEGGAMGVHFVKGDLVGDGKVDAANPEALIYEYRNGRFNLVGVEYVVIAEDWDKANDMPPVLNGQLFTYTGSPNRYRIPAFYALHVWAFRDNPNGMFADWNPRVSCEQFSGDHPM